LLGWLLINLAGNGFHTLLQRWLKQAQLSVPQSNKWN